MEYPEGIPDSGAVFTFGSSKLTGNTTSCFWLKNDVIISAACGDEHTALVTEKGKVYVFGSNNWGQLGLGNTHPSKKPTCVKKLKGVKATMVACGRNHTLVCTSDDQVFAFGNNSDFQLGIGSVSNSDVPLPVKVASFGKIKQIAAGADFSILLNSDGNVYAWGSNAEGQLGLGHNVNEEEEPTMIQGLEQIQHVACGYYHTALASASGKIYTFGEDEFGKLGKREHADTSIPSVVKVPLSLKVKRVACGGSHTAFLTEMGKIFTFGGGTHGELGHGADTLQIWQPTEIERLKKHEVVHVSCGENFTSAVTKKGRLYTFGDGRHGKLAGDEENFVNQFRPFRCRRFDKYSARFAICGGCHMVVSATMRHSAAEEADSEEEDPMRTDIDGQFNMGDHMHAVTDINGHSTISKVNLDLSRSLSARQKRRQGRQKELSQTLPPLRTLRTDELIEAAKSLPKPIAVHQSISNEWPTHTKAKALRNPDEVSEISAFNKVHTLTQVGGLDTFVPVQRLQHRKESLDQEEPELEEDSEDEELDLERKEHAEDIPQTSDASNVKSKTGDLVTSKQTGSKSVEKVSTKEDGEQNLVKEIPDKDMEHTDEEAEDDGETADHDGDETPHEEDNDQETSQILENKVPVKDSGKLAKKEAKKRDPETSEKTSTGVKPNMHNERETLNEKNDEKEDLAQKGASSASAEANDQASDTKDKPSTQSSDTTTKATKKSKLCIIL